jgi:hypothetical protein
MTTNFEKPDLHELVDANRIKILIAFFFRSVYSFSVENRVSLLEISLNCSISLKGILELILTNENGTWIQRNSLSGKFSNLYLSFLPFLSNDGKLCF